MLGQTGDRDTPNRRSPKLNRKRHIVTDTLGLLLVVLVTAASVQDRDGGGKILKLLHRAFPGVELVWADGAAAHLRPDADRRGPGRRRQAADRRRTRLDLKGALRLRPVYHRRDDRIRAHVQLCCLALLLIRVIKNTFGDTWRTIRHELDRMQLVTLATRDGTVAQRSITTAGQQTIWRALNLPEPPRFFHFTHPGPRTPPRRYTPRPKAARRFRKSSAQFP